MPLNQIETTPIIYGALVSSGVSGASASSLSIGLSNALCIYGTGSMNVTTIDAGLLGVGAGFGTGVVLPIPILVASLFSFMPANGFSGVSSPQIILGVSIGFSAVLATAIISTIHPTVGIGAGKLLILPNTSVSVGIFITAFAAAGMAGPMSVSLATAIASGLDAALPSAQGVVAIVGSPSIAPSGGVGFGKLL